MIERTMKIKLENGLEARPVAVLVQKASMHDSTIYIHAEGKKVNAKRMCSYSNRRLKKNTFFFI